MKVVFATDHAGFEYKEVLVGFVRELGYDVKDFGAFKLNPKDDYPDFISKAGQAVADNPTETMAIILGGSGQGEAIMANRYIGVRAVVYNNANLELITLAREHNDANILSLGARFISIEDAKEAVALFLKTPFSNDPRHVRRIREIREYS